jgi:predicted NAD/FAD-binding protein
MSFSVQCARTGLEYRGSSFGTFFAQRRNLFRWRHWRLLREILRFNREAPRLLDEQETDLTLGAWLEERRYGPALAEHYLVPMSAALWSADPGHALEFPAHYFVRFFENHGFFRLEGRPAWLVIRGGSQRYVDRLVRAFEDRIRTATPVRGIRRFEDRVQIEVEGGGAEAFDAVVLAVHSDQALQMLEDPSQAEREVLGAIPYQRNEAILHTDPSVMPHCRRAWSSWNYHVPESATGQATVTYHMNRLQSLPDDPPFFVTLNREDAVDSESVLRRITYHHPVYTPRSRAAQLGHVRISGVRNTWYCGAYWGWGFHEDGVRSALDVCADFGLNL